MSYTNLHQHSKFSALDGLGEVDSIVLKAKELGFKGVCISDHGFAGCWYDLYKSCKEHKMKPIFANEMYFTPNGISVKEKIQGWKPAYHLLVIAQNDIGFKNLMKLTSISYIEGKYYKPRIGYPELYKYGEGLIVLQACLGGLIAQLVLENRLEEAEDHLLRFKKILGDRYFLECQYTGIPEQLIVNKQFKEWSRKHNIEYVITADSHYVEKDDSQYHAALIAINIGGKIKKPISLTDSTKEDADTDNSGLFYTPNEYYIKPYSILSNHFNDSDDLAAFACTNRIADICNVNFVESGDYLPKFLETKEEEFEQLSKTCHEKLKSLVKFKVDQTSYEEYRKRLDYELDIINKMGYCGYFLIVADYIKWANDNGIITGPGRGSAAGSIVTYLMDITRIDPIEYGLIFSRFLNAGRSKLPQVEFEEYTLAQWQEEKKNTRLPF